MKKPLIASIALAGLSLAFTGCATHDRGAYLPQNVSINDLENRTALVLLSKRVQYSITCPGIQETRLPDGRLQVAVNLRNREERRIQVQVNCEFKDAQGFVIDNTPFENVFFDENAQQGVRFVSMNDKAVRYTIRVREAH
jgi:nuclear transport factor 2 (NTF2) superfamily protein